MTTYVYGSNSIMQQQDMHMNHVDAYCCMGKDPGRIKD